MIACPECDALQREPRRLPRGTRVSCWRCRTVLIQGSHRGVDHVFALVVTGSILFLVGNAFPLVSLEAQGNQTQTTLLGAALHMWQQDMHLIASLVLVTTILAPAFDLAAMLYLTMGALAVDRGRAERMPLWTAPVLRAVQAVRPWGMLEVFMLGALVSIVKLGQMASVIVGPALYSIGLLTLILAAANSRFDPREIWARMPVRTNDAP
jgi:paraquat-inducible protein A